MTLWMAFIFGLLGSLHCIGMCGPIVIALPSSQQNKSSFVLKRLIYNSGRVVTYSILGAFCGWVGQTIKIAGYQSTLSISLGILILLMVFLPSKCGIKIFPFGFYHKSVLKVKAFWGKLFKSNSYMSFLLIGLLNGFLPCGLVYIALAAAASTGSTVDGLMYMLMFGVGTIPIMLAVSYLGLFIGVSLKRKLQKLIPVGGVILAVLIILRGLSLGIPFVSPKIIIDQAGEQKVECCHPVEK